MWGWSDTGDVSCLEVVDVEESVDRAHAQVDRPEPDVLEEHHGVSQHYGFLVAAAVLKKYFQEGVPIASVLVLLEGISRVKVLEGICSAKVCRGVSSVEVLQGITSVKVLQSISSVAVLQSISSVAVLQSISSVAVLQSISSVAVLQGISN